MRLLIYWYELECERVAHLLLPESERIDHSYILNQTFIHAVKRVGADSLVVNHGHEVYLSSIEQFLLLCQLLVNMGVTHVSVAWVIENIQTGTEQ